MDEDTPIEQKMLSGAIENAQRQVESKNFQSRKSVLEYDDVMNTQRKVIYEQRRQVLDGEDLAQNIQNMIRSVITSALEGHMGEQKHMDAEGWEAAVHPFRGIFLRGDELHYADEELASLSLEELSEQVCQRAYDVYAKKEAAYTAPIMRELERVIMLRVVDEYWREGYEMFEAMVAAIQEETVRRLFLVRIQPNATVQRERVAKVTGESGGGDGTVTKQPVKKTMKIGRNDPCPCGSGKKWKKCDCAEYHPDGAAK